MIVSDLSSSDFDLLFQKRLYGVMTKEVLGHARFLFKTRTEDRFLWVRPESIPEDYRSTLLKKCFRDVGLAGAKRKGEDSDSDSSNEDPSLAARMNTAHRKRKRDTTQGHNGGKRGPKSASKDGGAGKKGQSANDDEVMYDEDSLGLSDESITLEDLKRKQEENLRSSAFTCFQPAGGTGGAAKGILI